MRQLSLEEIENLDNGEIIPSFTAKIKKVFPQKKGENERGDWFLQNMIVSDGSKEITVTWGGEDRFDKWEGRELIFESSDTNHGKQGLKWEVRNVGDKTYKGVKVTGAAKIHEVGDSPSPAAKQADVREQGNWQERAEIPREDRITTGSQLRDPVKEAYDAAARYGNAYRIALQEAHESSNQFERDFLGSEVSQEQRQSAVAMFFIQLGKDGKIANLPTTPLPARDVRGEIGKIVEQIEEHGVAGHN